MTAEVAVLNKNAVALAADSKISIGSGRPEKTYDTVNKIFTLSKIHPIGVMIYGNADFMQYPWETIIKLYRAQKKGKSETTVERWAADFSAFVRRFGKIRKKDIESNIFNVLYSMFRRVEDDALFIAHLRKISIQSSQYEDILVEELVRGNNFLGNQGALLSSNYFQQVIAGYGNIIIAAVGEFTQDSKNRKLTDTAVEFASRALMADYFSPQSSGYVVAGFGSTEVFPRVVACETDGYIGRKIKSSKPSLTKITLENDSAINAFAQHEIVRRFMEGIDPDYADYLRGLFRKTLIGSNLNIFEKWAPKSKKNKKTRLMVERAADKQYKEILDRSIDYRRNEFEQPTLDMVALLPKEDLANLAESLVGLTSLHRRVSRDLETVGGPIDVAIISKGDGFIWTKRKHYFKLEQNRHFELNYLKEIKGA